MLKASAAGGRSGGDGGTFGAAEVAAISSAAQEASKPSVSLSGGPPTPRPAPRSAVSAGAGRRASLAGLAAVPVRFRHLGPELAAEAWARTVAWRKAVDIDN
jgi:hypothetical protein